MGGWRGWRAWAMWWLVQHGMLGDMGAGDGRGMVVWQGSESVNKRKAIILRGHKEGY